MKSPAMTEAEMLAAANILLRAEFEQVKKERDEAQARLGDLGARNQILREFLTDALRNGIGRVWAEQVREALDGYQSGRDWVSPERVKELADAARVVLIQTSLGLDCKDHDPTANIGASAFQSLKEALATLSPEPKEGSR